MNRLIVLALVGVVSAILADAALKTALALPQNIGQAEAWRAAR
jgi:hypothetical protein